MSSLKRILCLRLPEHNRAAPIAETESNHAIKVLRLKDGDLVEALDGNGHSVIARLRTRNGPPRLEFHDAATSKENDSSVPAVLPLVLEVAILKGEAMEWVVEKAVELGVSKLTPVITAHTVVQVGKKGPEAFQERWQKIADQALKQCGRLDRMEVQTPIELESLLARKTESHRLWCNEMDRSQSVSLLGWLEKAPRSELEHGAHLLIGPEGGWSELERDLMVRHIEIASTKTHAVSLGPLVLRAETAAIFSASLIISFFREQVLKVS